MLQSALPQSHDALQRRLAEFNGSRLSPSVVRGGWEQLLANELQMRLLESRFLERELDAVQIRASEAPSEPDAFVAWFELLKCVGPGQGDPLFPWLAERASLADMSWFLTQESAGEAGFEDLLALTQVKFPSAPKLELARNYWDEMGQGHQGGMHGPLLERVVTGLNLDLGKPIVWESLALGNLMVGLATNRHTAYQSVGALGVIELTAPARAELVNQGMKRLGIAGEVRRYFALHATLDIRHSEAWNREVLRPLVAADSRTARPLAEGALARLAAGERCFARYRHELQFNPQQLAS